MLALAPLLALALMTLLAGCGGPQQQGQWELMGPSDGRQVESLTSDPRNPTRVYAASDDGRVYRVIADSTGDPSPGAGIPSNTFIPAVFADTQVTGRLYAGTSAGLYLSRDYGDTWARFGSGLPVGDSSAAFAESPDGKTLLTATSAHGVYLSRDQGATWHASSTGLPGGANVATLLWLPAANSQAVYAGLMGGGVYSSADGGQTWKLASGGLPAKSDVYALASLTEHSFATQGATLFAGTGKGLSISVDGGQTWRQEGTGLPAVKVLSLFSFPTYPGWIFAGTQQGVYLSPNGGHTWRVPAAGLEQPALSVIAAPSKQANYVLFAASGQIARFPPAVGATSPFGQIIPILLIVVLLGMCFYFFYVRQRRYSALLAEQERTGPPDAEGKQRFVYVPVYGADARTSKTPDDTPDESYGSGDGRRTNHPSGAIGGAASSLASTAKRLVSTAATNTRKMRGADKTAKPNKLPTPPTSDPSGGARGANTVNTINTASNTNARKNTGKPSSKGSGGKRPNNGRRS